MAPLLVDALVLLLLGAAGISSGLLLGIRNWVVLVVAALGASSVLRTLATFSVWSLDRPDWSTEAWLIVSAVCIGLADLFHWRTIKSASLALGVFGTLTAVALFTKYVLGIGERHHTDSSAVIAMAVVGIQGEMANLEQLSMEYKRGIAYTLLLGLGPEGRVLAGLTPLIFLSLLLATGWLSWQLVKSRIRPVTFSIIAIAVGIFSLSVPIFRAAMFYMNAHTLMAYGVILMLAGVFLARRNRRLEPDSAALLLLGGVIGATSRIEGITLVLVVMWALVSQTWWSERTDRIRLFTILSASGLSLGWWLWVVDSGALDRLGIQTWFVVAGTLLGAFVASSSLIDPVRHLLLPILGVGILVVLTGIVAMSSDPLSLVLAQWPNLGLGRGGWATAAHVFMASMVVLGLRHRSEDYRLLLGLAWLIIGTILFSKTFDGGFGREGFYDSVNRMWLHVLPVVLTAMLVGYSELVGTIRAKRRNIEALGFDSDPSAPAGAETRL